FTAVGGVGTVQVQASRSSCTWTASSGADWIAVTGAASGTGNGSVSYAVAVNAGGDRSGTLTVAGSAVAITQSAVLPVCRFSIAPSSANVPADGGTTTVTVTASTPLCAWTATSNATWLTVTSAASGTGSGSVTVAAAANPGTNTRTASVTIAGQQ